MKQPVSTIPSRKKEFVKLAQVYADYAYAWASATLKNSARYDSIRKMLLNSRGLENHFQKRKVLEKSP